MDICLADASRADTAFMAHYARAVTAAGSALARQTCTTALHLLAEEHLTVLLPVRAHATLPSWLGPAVKDGWMLLFGARWRPLHALLTTTRCCTSAAPTSPAAHPPPTPARLSRCSRPQCPSCT
ncbi:hypothetical protein ACFW9N_41145 [Streptomyces sp. NPDC059496]|uniref:hypothetical protein n=1 Tax=Streptomyces sp. NPDC059496 TaxID=3346851 RepID=UPI00368EDBDC